MVFSLSGSKCTVSARFLHGFKTVSYTHLSLVLTLASNDEALTQDELAECIADAKAQIIDCNLLLKNAAQDEEDDL